MTCATTSGCVRPTPPPAIAALVEAGELVPVTGRGLVPARPTCTPTPGCRARIDGLRAAQPVRLADLASATGTEALFGFRYRHRDLRAAARARCTATTCCRSCSATGWSPGSTSRPTGSTPPARPAELLVQRRPGPSPGPADDLAVAAGRRADRAGGLAGPGRDRRRSRRAATWRPRCGRGRPRLRRRCWCRVATAVPLAHRRPAGRAGARPTTGRPPG